MAEARRAERIGISLWIGNEVAEAPPSAAQDSSESPEVPTLKILFEGAQTKYRKSTDG